MRRPITLAMFVVAVIGGGVLALLGMRVDIFPSINAPQIYVVNNYAGMSPDQIEGIVTNVYEQNFQYVDGIKAIESKNIQNFVQLKLTFYPGTDMAAAMSQVVSLTNRARGQMPPSVLPPFVIRFDAASVPIGYLVLESKSDPPRPLGELADLGLFRIRPTLIAEVPGTVAFSPYGSNTRAIVVTVDPDRLRAHNLSPEDLVSALETGNVVVPSGNVYTPTQTPLVPTNAMVADPQEMGKIPIQLGKNVYLRDVATIEDTTDINYGCALVNGRKSIFIPVVKKDTASTLTVVRQIHDTMPKFKLLVPADVDVRYAFDESPTVRAAIQSVLTEGVIGAGLTGLMILLFLHDLRSVLVVLISIPLSLTSSLVGLWLTGNTINIMSLGGLALAIGILVDEATVTIENTHAQMRHTHSIARAAPSERRHQHGAALGHALHPLGVHSHAHPQRAGPLAVHALDAGRGLRHGRLLPVVQHARTRAHRVACEARGRARRAGRKVALRSLPGCLCKNRVGRSAAGGGLWWGPIWPPAPRSSGRFMAKWERSCFPRSIRASSCCVSAPHRGPNTN